MTEKLINTHRVQEYKANPLSSYYASYAAALVYYGKENSGFRSYLYERIEKNFNATHITHPVDIESRYSRVLLPQNEDIARRRLNWMIEKILSDEEDAVYAREIFFNAYNNREFTSPKSIIIGIKIGIIPGLTLGNIKIKRSVKVVLDQELESDTLKVSKLITQGTTSLLENEFKKSNYDLKKIEPDISEWLFGDKCIDIYKVSHDELLDIESDLGEFKYSFISLQEKENIPQILIISPAINLKVFN